MYEICIVTLYTADTAMLDCSILCACNANCIIILFILSTRRKLLRKFNVLQKKNEETAPCTFCFTGQNYFSFRRII